MFNRRSAIHSFLGGVCGLVFSSGQPTEAELIERAKTKLRSRGYDSIFVWHMEKHIIAVAGKKRKK